MDELTERERKVIGYGIEDTKCDRLPTLNKCFDNYGGESEVRQRFAAGGFGAHEATDRAWLIMENWMGYVLEHPTVLMNPEAHRMAYIAQAFMQEVYQIVGCAEPDTKEPIPSRQEPTK